MPKYQHPQHVAEHLDVAELIRRCLEDDEQAWADLLHRLDRLINAVIRRSRLRDADGADVYQRVAIALHRKLSTIRQPDRLAAWIITTTRRECIREWRRIERSSGINIDPDDVQDDQDLGGHAERLLELAHVAAAIDQLQPPCRELLTLLFLDDQEPSYNQIAARLGIAVGSIGPTRARCLEALRRRLRAGRGRHQTGGRPTRSN
jgi:RNA polymerase sigma factor (sigma-70 family)